MNNEIKVAIIGFLAVLFSNIISSVLSSKFYKQNSTYENTFCGVNKANDALSDFMISLLYSIKNKNVNSMLNKLRIVHKNGMFGFSQDTIRQWNNMNLVFEKHDYDKAIIEYAKVILQIRKDIGYKEKLKPEEMLFFLQIKYLNSGIVELNSK